MSTSDPDAATPHSITTTPALVSMVATATGSPPPSAFVSLEIEFAVAVPLLDAPNAVAERASVATGAFGDPAGRNRRNPLLPISAVTASVAAFRAATL
jgi:hypothetical protein